MLARHATALTPRRRAPLGQIRGYKNDKFGSLDMCYAIDTKAPDMPTSCADAKLFALYKTIAK